MMCTECQRKPDTMSCPPCSHLNCKCDGDKKEKQQCTFASTSGSCRLCSGCSDAMKRCQKCTREIQVEKGIFIDEVLGDPLPASELK